MGVRAEGWSAGAGGGTGESRERDRIVKGRGDCFRLKDAGGGSGLRVRKSVTQAWGLPGVEEAEEHGEIWAPGEQAEDESTAAADDLSGNEDDALDE